MQRKFLIFIDDNERPSIYLDFVNWHRDIPVPPNTTCRCGGGKWQFIGDALRLYDLSGDFGKYDKKYAKEAFDNKRVFYLGECIFDDGDLKNIILE